VKLRTTLAAIVVVLALPASASAAQVVAGPTPVSYQNPNVTIDQGEQLSFLNLDLTAPHDVTALDPGPGGTALFRSETVGALAQVPVVGADKLDPGSYDFVCSVHSFMTGTLTVRGGHGDHMGDEELKVSVTPLDKSLKEVERKGAIRVRVKLSMPAKVRLGAKPVAGGAQVAGARKKLKRGKSVVAMKLTSSGERLVHKAPKRLDLELSAKATHEGHSQTRSVELTLR
jgi:plastocyanin